MKRQSEIQREKKKSRQEEREEEKARKASYYRKVTGILGDDATNHLGRFPNCHECQKQVGLGT